MKRTYRQSCGHCGRYYEGRGRLFCSMLCRNRNITTKGQKRTKDFYKKMSLLKIGNKARLGMKNSEEHRRKISEAQSGEKGNNWRGGLSFEPYGLEFNKELKEKIFQRDNCTCRECNYPKGMLKFGLVAHHINFNKKDNCFSNLITLCRSCHSKTNFNRDKWIDYYRKVVSRIYAEMRKPL